MPRARNAIVGLRLRVDPVRRSSRRAPTPTSPTSSASATRSPRAHPTARSRSGITWSVHHLLHLVRHAGHRVDDLAVADRARAGPGAVPIGFGIASPPSGMSAWRRLFCGHVAAADAEHRRDVLDELLAPLERHAHHLGDRVAGEVVLGRAEPAAHDARRRPRRAGRAAPRRCAPGCRRPRGARRCRCPTRRAARRSTRCSCRRSGRAAARSRSPGPHIASARSSTVSSPAVDVSRAGRSPSPTRR